MSWHRFALLLLVCTFPGVNRAAAQCTQYPPYTLFGHDTYGFLFDNVPPVWPWIQGPSRPCETMKAVTEGLVGNPPLPRTVYFTARIYGTTDYSNYLINHGGAIAVGYIHLASMSENLASYPTDFTFWEQDCTFTLLPSTNYTFHLPLPCPLPVDPIVCATAGNAVIEIVAGDSQWEAPELVRIKMDSATSTLPGVTATVGTENSRSGSVIQDECESGALFKYPATLPSVNSQPGYTVQVATSLPRGSYTPDFNGISFPSHVDQNYPCAASEVVTEGSWLEFAIALLDENAAGGPTGAAYDVAGNVVQAPAPLIVTFEFFDRGDWSPQGGCTDPPATWDHYATQGLMNDFVVERFDHAAVVLSDPFSGWVVVQPSSSGDSTVTVPQGQSLLRLRFHAVDNNVTPTPIEVAHLHIKSASFQIPPPFDPIPRIGWSSDFRFLIQENSQCPQ